MARNTIQPWFLMLHQEPLPPRWINLSFIWLMCLPIVHAHRMGTWNNPIRSLLTRYEVGQWLGFGWFWSWGTSDMQLARRKLGKKTHPNHGGSHCPIAAMVPYPRHRRIQQLANMMHDKSMTLKLDNIIVFTVYLLAILRHDASLTHCAWMFVGCTVLRVSYSQQAALRL